MVTTSLPWLLHRYHGYYIVTVVTMVTTSMVTKQRMYLLDGL